LHELEALRFVPKEDLEKEGYGEYSKLFAKKVILPRHACPGPYNPFLLSFSSSLFQLRAGKGKRGQLQYDSERLTREIP